MGYSPWGHRESDRTEELSMRTCAHTHTHTHTHIELGMLFHLKPSLDFKRIRNVPNVTFF